jgi:hypothetical protein
LFFCVFSKVGFESFGKFTAGKHNAASTAFTFESDIRPEAYDGPFVGATRMLFAKAQVVVELEVGEHMGEFRMQNAKCVNIIN